MCIFIRGNIFYSSASHLSCIITSCGKCLPKYHHFSAELATLTPSMFDYIATCAVRLHLRGHLNDILSHKQKLMGLHIVGHRLSKRMQLEF